MKLKAPVFNKATIPCYAAAILMILVFVMLFMPFWHFTTTEKVKQADGTRVEVEVENHISINSYVWFPEDNKDLRSELKTLTESSKAINVTETVLQPILMLVLSVVGTGFCLLKPTSKITPFLPILLGLSGIWCFAGEAIYRTGSHWVPLLICCILTLCCGAVALANQFIKKKALPANSN